MDLGFKIDTREVKKALARIDKDFDRATMYGLRAAGRVGKQEARRMAPRDTGALRDSVHTAKRLKGNSKAGYRNYVGPWGGKVNLYRDKAEASKPYMRPAYETVTGRMNEKFVAAYTRVLTKAGRI